MAVIIVLTVIFLFIPLAKQDETQNSLTDVIKTIKRLVDFYKTEYRNINVDSLYGLRVLEGTSIDFLKIVLASSKIIKFKYRLVILC